VQHDAHRHIILIHVLDLVDEEQWIELIQTRYEGLLLEIFE
jgi:multicomponent K+:H+ antiporter subunit E